MTPTPSASQTASADAGEGVERTMSGETVHGFKVEAWRYHAHGDNPEHGHRYCEHWSTPGRGAWAVERMFTEEQLRAALRQTSSESVAWEFRRVGGTDEDWRRVSGALAERAKEQSHLYETRPIRATPTAPEHAAGERVRVLENVAPCLDKHGIPIERGDIVKVFHFVGARGKRNYMFKQCLGAGRYPNSPESWSGIFFSHLTFCEIGDRNGPYHEEPGKVLSDYEIVQSINHDHDERPKAAPNPQSQEKGV